MDENMEAVTPEEGSEGGVVTAETGAEAEETAGEKKQEAAEPARQSREENARYHSFFQVFCSVLFIHILLLCGL